MHVEYKKDGGKRQIDRRWWFFVFLFFLPLVIGFKALSMEMFRTKILFQKRKVFFLEDLHSYFSIYISVVGIFFKFC